MLDTRAIQLTAFHADVIAGLSHRQKSLPSRWLYDPRGSDLFEQITRLEEYYPTRVETSILRQHARDMARVCGRDAVIFEYGAGAAIKTEILLSALEAPRMYVPIDIAGDFLTVTVDRIGLRFPRLEIRPVVGDFTADFDIPADLPQAGRRCGFFPGSTIGNLDHAEATAFLRRMGRHVGAPGMALVGVDLRKDIDVLLAAYDDREGVTAAFDLNLLVRINRELSADFPLEGFAHEARWNAVESAIEMHLVSLDDCVVTVAGQPFRFEAGETIHTESSRKYDLEALAGVVESCGWAVRQVWTDSAQRFAVVGLAVRRDAAR